MEVVYAMEKRKKMTAREVAEMLGVTTPAVYLWKKEGLMGTVEKIGGTKPRTVYTMEDLMNFFGVDSVEQMFKERGKRPYVGGEPDE